MRATAPWKSYKQIATQTAPPGVLVLMLFDGALRSLKHASTGFAFRDPREKNETIHNNLQQATDIIRELDNALNIEAGGHLARTLRNLYHYFIRRLIESNLRKRREGVDEVLRHLEELREAWAAMLAQRGQEQPAEWMAV